MQTITTAELKEMTQRTNDLAVLNVLPPEDFQSGHIPDSKNVPLGSADFEKQVEGLAGGRDRAIVVYCASEECTASPKAAKRLDKAGFKNVFDYEAGMRGWQDAGLPVERGE